MFQNPKVGNSRRICYGWSPSLSWRALLTYPFELSGGLRQRALIAMVLVCVVRCVMQWRTLSTRCCLRMASQPPQQRRHHQQQLGRITLFRGSHNGAQLSCRLTKGSHTHELLVFVSCNVVAYRPRGGGRKQAPYRRFFTNPSMRQISKKGCRLGAMPKTMVNFTTWCRFFGWQPHQPELPTDCH